LGAPISKLGVLLQDWGPLNLITALCERKTKKEDAVMLGKK